MHLPLPTVLAFGLHKVRVLCIVLKVNNHNDSVLPIKESTTSRGMESSLPIENPFAVANS